MTASNVRRAAGWAGLIVASFAAGSALMRAVLRGAPLWLASDLAQPLPVVTAWHDFGTALLSVLCCTAGAAALAYWMLLRAIDAGSAAERRALLLLISLASVIAGLLAILGPVIFSSDVYAYAAYGDLSVHALNPYARMPIVLRDDILRAAIWQWGNPPPISVYGPVFMWFARAMVALFGAFGVAATLDAFRICSVLALPACGLLAYAALQGWSTRRRLVVAAGIALNPVAIWSASEGHNDALMLLVVLAGIIAWRRIGPFSGALIIACAALVKAPGAAAGAALALFAWGNGQRKRFYKTLAGLCAGGAIVAILALPFEQGVVRVFIPQAHYAPEFSAQWLSYMFTLSVLPASLPRFELGIAVALGACLLLFLRGARLQLRGDLRGLGWMALGVWLVIPNAYPWYGLWILPIALVLFDVPIGKALVAASLGVILRYAPDATRSDNLGLDLAVTLCEIAPALIVAFWPSALRLPRTPAVEAAPR